MSNSLLNSLLPIPHQKRISKSKTPNYPLKELGSPRCFPIPIRNKKNWHPNRSIVCEKMEDDGFYMRKCVELAKKAIGRTSPNPMVGCVVVKGDEIVGQGFHPKVGQPHAEVFALRDAGTLAENATAYVSLEPCNHYGRTPPCTEALICAKVKRVVVGMVDPNPIVASKGVEKLRASGIDVTVGIEELLCQKLNEAYIHRMLTGKPFATLRYSMSFDGRILNRLGEGAEESGGYFSKLLEEYDGIVSSSNLYTKTSSLPVSHETGANQPLQILIARGDSLCPSDSITKSSSRVIVLAEKPITLEPDSEAVEVVVLEKMNLRKILDYCGQQGLCSVILDLRGDDGYLTDLLGDGFNDNLVQKVVMELCPVLGRNQEFSNLTFGRKSLSLKDVKSRVSNNSVIVEGFIS